jgi:hypothetical protein
MNSDFNAPRHKVFLSDAVKNDVNRADENFPNAVEAEEES